ncbi:AfsA-related hotdog domain-containing protein [Nocardia sp. NPDC055321]
MNEVDFEPVAIGLTFDQTVPCALAHRRAVGEVFVTDSARLANGDVWVAIQLPRAHSLWFDRSLAIHDPLSVAEAARQGTFVALHRHCGVPLGVPFSLKSWRFEIATLGPFVDNERAPLEGFVRYRVGKRVSLGSNFEELSLEGQVSIGGVLAMTAHAEIVFFPPDDYKAIRSFQRSGQGFAGPDTLDLPKRMDSSAVGRSDPRNVVIGDGGDYVGSRFPLVVDVSHPSFFDHSYDHAPGPLLVEGFRQAAIVAATRAGALETPVCLVAGCDVAFTHFGELDSPMECSAAVVSGRPGVVAVQVGLHQDGRELAAGTLELSLAPDAAARGASA